MSQFSIRRSALPGVELKLSSIVRKIICCALAGGSLCMVAFAQHYSFSEAASGMDNLDVDCVAQDSAGYLWVGTENGLYQYDGVQYTKIGPANGLNARTIQDILPGPGGTLLVGTTEGVFFRGSNGSFTEVHPPDPTTRFSLRIGSVFTQTAPNQIVLTDRSGVYLLRQIAPARWAAEAMHLSNEQVWSVLHDPAGPLWYGCGDDLCRISEGKIAHMGAQLHLPREQWLHMKFDGRGRLWLRGGTHIGEIDLTTGRYTEHSLPGQSNATPYDALAVDGQGRILASQGPSFGIWTGDRWRMVTTRSGLTRYDISALVADREGSIWIGSAGHGIRRWVGQDSWEAFTVDEGLSDDIIWASLRDRAGRLWVGTESGLDWFPPGSKSARHWHSPTIASVRALSLAMDPGGNIWMGSGNGLLVRIDPHSLAGRSWKIPEVYYLFCDGRQSLWIATNHGLYVLDTKAARPQPRLITDPVIANPQARFRHLSSDAEGRIWASSDDALYRLDARGWVRIDPGLSGIVPQQVVVDRTGTLWASGAFPGIMRMRVSGNKVVESEHILSPHLLSEQVVSLAEDSRGWLWIGQDAGVTVFDGRAWRNFTRGDGLVWNDTDTYGISEDTDGSMWIGTSGGLSHLLKPDAIPALAPNRPAVSRIAFGTVPVSDGSEIRWSAAPLTIALADLNFRDAHHIRVRYRLLGLESEWVEADDETLRYARLAPGHYTFQAETEDLAGNRVSPLTQVDFRILPRWWQTWESKLALLVLAALALTLFWRWRVHLLVRQKRHLQRAVLERTHELEKEKTELLRAREQMRHFAEHDDLTGLVNHRIVIERLRSEVDRSRRQGVPLSIVMVDLDHFKTVNDTYGHATGDAVLKEVGAVFERSVRSYDWVGRYGGEEFLLILPGTTFTDARKRAEQMRLTLQATEIVDNGSLIRVTASLGVASGFPRDYESLIRAADSALYRAKNSGRNCVTAVEIETPGAGGKVQAS
jgi:diguanylate cyclase (GGDEF)-like protein